MPIRHPRVCRRPLTVCGPCGVNLPFGRLSRGGGQVAYALLTRAPVAGGASTPLPLDLHVLGLSLAFILSQDQTLRCMNCSFLSLSGCPSLLVSPPFGFDGRLLCFPVSFLFVYRQSFKDLSSRASGPPPRLPCHFRGAKVRRIFASAKSFSIFFRTASAVRSSLKSGCKGRGILRLLQTFPYLFSEFFYAGADLQTNTFAFDPVG